MGKTRRNGEGSIRQRSDGRYEVRISGAVDYATGKSVRISKYAQTEEEAISLLHRLSFQMGLNHNKVSNMTLGQWLDLWMAGNLYATQPEAVHIQQL